MDTVLFVTLSLTINETLEWLPSLPILIQESFCWRQCSDRYIYIYIKFPSPPPLSSLINLVVSVDVKHHVYLRSVISRELRMR